MTRFLIAGALALAASVPALAQDMPLSQVLVDGEPWELVAEGFKFTEGPAVDAQGNVQKTVDRGNVKSERAVYVRWNIFKLKDGRTLRGTIRNLVCPDLAVAEQLCGRQQGSLWTTPSIPLGRSVVVAQVDLPPPGQQ